MADEAWSVNTNGIAQTHGSVLGEAIQQLQHWDRRHSIQGNLEFLQEPLGYSCVEISERPGGPKPWITGCYSRAKLRISPQDWQGEEEKTNAVGENPGRGTCSVCCFLLRQPRAFYLFRKPIKHPVYSSGGRLRNQTG